MLVVAKHGEIFTPPIIHCATLHNMVKWSPKQVRTGSLGFGFIRHGLNKDNCLGKENTGKSS